MWIAILEFLSLLISPLTKLLRWMGRAGLTAEQAEWWNGSLTRLTGAGEEELTVA